MEAQEKKMAVEVSVSKLFTKGKNSMSPEEVKDEVLAVRTFVTEPAVIGIDNGLTINLGNYESARLGVSIRVPCYLEEIDAAYEFANDFVEKRIAAERNAIRSASSSNSHTF